MRPLLLASVVLGLLSTPCHHVLCSTKRTNLRSSTIRRRTATQASLPSAGGANCHKSPNPAKLKSIEPLQATLLKVIMMTVVVIVIGYVSYDDDDEDDADDADDDDDDDDDG